MVPHEFAQAPTDSARSALAMHRRLAAVLAVAVVVSGSAPFAAHAAPSDPLPLAALAKQFIAESEAHDPLFADGIGIHTHDDELADYSAGGRAVRAAWLASWETRFDAVIANAPSENDLADATALRDSIRLEQFENATLKPYATDPTLYANVLGQAIYALTARTYAPLDVRMRHVAARLARLPAVVAAAKASLTHPARVVTLQAIDETAGTVGLLRSLPDAAKGASPATRAAIARNLPAAIDAVASYGTFLTSTVLPRSNGSTRVGAAVYDRELQLQLGTDASRAELVARATRDLAETRKRMLALAIPLDRKFFPTKIADETKPNAVDVVVRRVLDKLADDHPSRTQVFSAARADVERAEAFLAKDPVVVVPRPNTLHVVPTPAFQAGFAGASEDSPGPFTPLAESYYYIDEIPAAWSNARVESYLREYNTYEMQLLSMHEAMPGHYVQIRYNNATPSLVRRIFGNGSFIEGWAVYTEGMMLDAGFGAGDPRLRLFQLKWRLREQANTIIDAGYHAGGMTRAQLDDLLVRQAYQEKSEADTKWHRLQLSHDQLSSYYTGLDAIRRAEEAQRARLGARFSVAKFNAALLHIGSVEPRFVASLVAEELP
jgi:hypothetical protein